MTASRSHLRSSLAAANRRADEERKERTLYWNALLYISRIHGTALVTEAVEHARKYGHRPSPNAGTVTS